MGKAIGVSNKGLVGTTLANGNIRITNFDGSYPGASGEVLLLSGHYTPAV